MLQHEDISNVQEIKGKFKVNWLSSSYLRSHLDILGFSRIKRSLESCKKGGICVNDLLSVLLVLPILGMNTIHSFIKGNDNSICLVSPRYCFVF